MGMDEVMEDSDARMERIKDLSERMWDNWVKMWDPDEDGEDD